MTKEDRVVRYLERASKELLYDTGYYKEELGISDEDIREIQKKRETEISLKPTEKRNLVVKQSIKPLLKIIWIFCFRGGLAQRTGGCLSYHPHDKFSV